MTHFDVIIIGAGAAGMFCAIEAGRRGRTVLVLDHAKTAGEKIRISGGGRCNFTNLDIRPERFLSQNPKFAISALKRYSQWDFIDRVDAAGITWHEKTLGQLFCVGSAQQIISLLLADMKSSGVELALNTEVKSIWKQEGGYKLALNNGVLFCQSLVVACGGKSIPKMGASGFGYQLAAEFGVPVTQTRPALVPLRFSEPELGRMRALAGTAVAAELHCNGASFTEGLLFTHRGLSGPSILQISSYWREGDNLSINLLPGRDCFSELIVLRAGFGGQSLARALSHLMPKAIAALVLADLCLVGNIGDQADRKLRMLAEAIQNWRVKPAGSEGYRTAEVTLGGVDTNALDPKTMQARSVTGLYFIGEVVDVTGWLGGYNFQWAWSSGWVAGQVV